jgi:lysophospholipase L1-like esterase
MTIVWGFLIVLCTFLLLEAFSRLYHRFHYLTPFRPRIVGEYPFKSFIEVEDAPIFFTFKKGFQSDIIHINRFGIRGPEPAVDGSKKRILVIGESNIFGVKLLRERELWSVQMAEMLSENGYGDWEVLNAGNPGYNTFQHRAFWERELHRVNPDILLLSMGMNEITQAWVMGSQWKRGAPWPIEFIFALERRSPWWNKLVGYSCLYFLVRRGLFASARFPFTPKDDGFQWEECSKAIFENFRSIIEDARNMGAKVATFEGALAYDFQLTDDDKKRVSSVQSNWETFLTAKGRYDYQFLDELANRLAPEMGVPHINLGPKFRKHPRRFELYFDLGHVNGEGMTVYAEAIYEEIDKLNWWS